MRNWKEFQSEVFDYVDGLLPDEQRKRLDKQMQASPAALEFFNEVRALRRQLKSLRQIKTSPDFDTVLRTQIQMEKNLSRRSLFGWTTNVPVALTAGALALVAVLFVAGSFQSDREMQIATARRLGSSATTFRSVGNSTGVNYPMDLVQSHGGGIKVDSRNRNQRASANADSVQTLPKDRPIVTVEF